MKRGSKTRYAWLSLVFLPVFLTGCEAIQDLVSKDKDKEPEGQAPKAELDASSLLLREPEIISRAPKDASNRLAFDLYKQLKATDNLTYSPMSISLALAMVYAGAKGETQAAMMKGLHFGENNLDFHKSYGEFANLLSTKDRSADDTVLKISNGQWLQSGFTIFSDYIDLLSQGYAASPRQLNFGGDPRDATKTINDAVSEQTMGEIKELIKQTLGKDTRLVLTNAMYFKSKWQSGFNKTKTSVGGFKTKSGTDMSASYMKQEGRFLYGEDDEKQVLLMPYRDEDFAAVFILPKEGKFESVENSLSAQKFADLLAGFESKKVNIWLPKFSHRTSPNMKESLENLGLGIMFDEDRADLSKINGITHGDGKLYVSDVIHEAVVKMYEEGTTAAAATAVPIMAVTSMPLVEDMIDFHATRPFMYFIIHKESKTILFMGRVDTPESDEGGNKI